MLQKAAQISTQRGFKMAAKLLDFLLKGLWFELVRFKLLAAFSWARRINDNFPLVLFPLLRHTVRMQWEGYLREQEVTSYVSYVTLIIISINDTIYWAQYGSVFMSLCSFGDKSWTVTSCVSCQYQQSDSVCLNSLNAVISKFPDKMKNWNDKGKVPDEEMLLDRWHWAGN